MDVTLSKTKKHYKKEVARGKIGFRTIRCDHSVADHLTVTHFDTDPSRRKSIKSVAFQLL